MDAEQPQADASADRGAHRCVDIRVGLAADSAEQNHGAHRREHVESLGKIRSRDGVVDDVDAGAARQVGDPFADILAIAVDHRIGAERADITCLVGAGGDAVDGQTLPFCELDQGAAGAAGRGMDQHRLAGARLGGVVQQQPTELVVAERHRLLGRYPLGYGEGGSGRHDNRLGIAAATPR